MLTVALLYFAVVAGIGIYSARRTRTARDFFVAGRGVGLVTLAIAAMATTLSGFTFIGGPGLIYRVGLGAMFIILPAALTNTMGAAVLARRLRALVDKREVFTIPEALAARYRSRAVQGWSAVAILLAVVSYMATNLLALGLVLESTLGLSLAPAICVGALVVLAYSASGGILAGLYTDVFQGLLMAVASTAVFAYALASGGGMASMSRTLLSEAPGFISPWGSLSPLAALSFFFVFGIGTLGQPHVAHKYFMLRDASQLRWFPVVLTLAMTLTLLLFVGVGVAVKVQVLRGVMPPLSHPDEATPAFLRAFTPGPLAALVLSAVTAAIMSTVNSFLSIGAAACTRDLPRAFGLTPRDELRRGRAWTVVLTLLSVLVALRSDTLVAFIGIFGWGLFASTLVPALAIGFNWPGATPAAALASIVTGLVATLSIESLAYLGWFRFPSGVTATALALVLSLLVFFVVSWVTRETAAEALDDDLRQVMEA